MYTLYSHDYYMWFSAAVSDHNYTVSELGVVFRDTLVSTNSRGLDIAASMLVHSLRRRPNIETTVG